MKRFHPSPVQRQASNIHEVLLKSLPLVSSELVAGSPRMSLTPHPGHNWLLTAKVDHQTLHPKISHILPNSGRNSQSKMNGQTKTPKAKMSTRHVDIARTTPSYLLSRDQNNTQLLSIPSWCTMTCFLYLDFLFLCEPVLLTNMTSKLTSHPPLFT